MRKLATGASAALALVLVAAMLPAAAGGSPPDTLQAARAANSRFHSFEQAQKAGYILPAGEPCVSSPLGAMGVHVINPALMADPSIDPLRPEILLYLPNEQGKLKLIGLEYWRADADQNLATSGDRPSVFGHPFDGPMPGHNPTMPIHYDLHVWFWETNPSGFFAPFNPAISCP
jgi:hypothetical protein